MKRPNPHDYSLREIKQHKYESDLEKYIDYLEGKLRGYGNS